MSRKAKESAKAGRTRTARGKYSERLPNGKVPFRKAINFITRKTSEAKALPAFKRYFMRRVDEMRKLESLTPDPERMAAIWKENIELWRANGMAEESMHRYHDEYAAQARCGKRPKKNA